MTSADTGQPRRVLVTGAGGKTGHAVIAAIRASGGQCRAVVHTSRDVAGAEAVVADQCSVDELVAALDGVDAVYAIAPNLSDAEIVMAEALIEACQRHGVERLVFHSVIHPQLVSMPHHRDKLHAEARLLESGLAVTILQPNVYMQNLAAFRAAMQAATLAVPYATDRPFGMVDLRDVAQVVARAVLDDIGVHATWELSGPANVTIDDVARLASRTLPRFVLAERVAPDTWMRSHPAATSTVDERLRAMFAHYDAHGSPGDGTVLAAVLDAPPRTIDAYLRELLAS